MKINSDSKLEDYLAFQIVQNVFELAQSAFQEDYFSLFAILL